MHFSFLVNCILLVTAHAVEECDAVEHESNAAELSLIQIKSTRATDGAAGVAIKSAGVTEEAGSIQDALPSLSLTVGNTQNAASPKPALSVVEVSTSIPSVNAVDEKRATSHQYQSQKSRVDDSSTGAAFVQMTQLAAEFQELREDDASHVRQLLYNVQLREQLREKIRAADELLAADNARLAKRTATIRSGANVSMQDGEASPEMAGPQNTITLGKQPLDSSANAPNVAALLQSLSEARGRREIKNENLLASTALQSVKQLAGGIAALRRWDDTELESLRTNARTRDALHAKIVSSSQQLNHDASDLVLDLEKIRSLVLPSDATAVVDGRAVDAINEDAAPSGAAQLQTTLPFGSAAALSLQPADAQGAR